MTKLILPEEARKLATNLIKKFDSNADGRVQRDEVPESFQRFAFRMFDKDRDDAISMDEAIQLAKDSLRRKKEQRDEESRSQRLN